MIDLITFILYFQIDNKLLYEEVQVILLLLLFLKHTNYIFMYSNNKSNPYTMHDTSETKNIVAY